MGYMSDHKATWDKFTANVNATPYLKAHRDFVEAYGFGYGDRPFHWVWKTLVEQSPDNLKFLEIGVFQGQVLSLVKLIAREMKKTATVFGITPLNTLGDKYATHPEMDYLERIKQIHNEFSLPSPVIMKGQSFDPRIQALAREEGPYDIVYVDGCHDYEVALDDLVTYSRMVQRGGFLVVDDAGNYLGLPDGMIPDNFKGLEDVSRAVVEWHRERQATFQEYFNVGHMRIFRRGQVYV
jgi:hypothetical protein